jgi:hypothetical protein
MLDYIDVSLFCFAFRFKKQNDIIHLLDITHVLLSFSNKDDVVQPWSWSKPHSLIMEI